ncbi:hypothetical protein FH972_025926 [Carpinus fangiana]|uniref:Autophagy-related protein 6 n=1 Tax=Carpinus fangiana TaxID=176857 RepID=A0A5N6L2T2_9ROSI|nr:hypothetical protein FH972_025926 [Carpinus fangiana]
MLTESQFGPTAAEQNGFAKSEREKDQVSIHGPESDTALSQEMEASARLFEILSARSDIDHPICVECTESLVQGMEKRMASAIRERDAYVDFLRQAHADVPSEEEERAAREELEAVKKEEEAALVELEALEAEKAALEEKMAAMELEASALDKEEEEFWRDRNAFDRELAAFQEEQDSLNQRYEHDARLLERLQRTNVYNDTFSISHDNHFGTINGLRLGRLSHTAVEWAEINAAWGQACLLLATVADKLNYKFQGFKLNPVGSTSTIDKFELPERGQSKTASSTNLPLYHTSDIPLNIGFLHRNFDNAMVALLECIRQLGLHVERTTQGTAAGGETGLRLPYEIKKDKIHDCSIKLSFGGEETWTKACKFTLTCCKFLLAHASLSRRRKALFGTIHLGLASTSLPIISITRIDLFPFRLILIHLPSHPCNSGASNAFEPNCSEQSTVSGINLPTTAHLGPICHPSNMISTKPQSSQEGTTRPPRDLHAVQGATHGISGTLPIVPTLGRGTTTCCAFLDGHGGGTGATPSSTNSGEGSDASSTACSHADPRSSARCSIRCRLQKLVTRRVRHAERTLQSLCVHLGETHRYTGRQP